MAQTREEARNTEKIRKPRDAGEAGSLRTKTFNFQDASSFHYVLQVSSHESAPYRISLSSDSHI